MKQIKLLFNPIAFVGAAVIVGFGFPACTTVVDQPSGSAPQTTATSTRTESSTIGYPSGSTSRTSTTSTTSTY